MPRQLAATLEPAKALAMALKAQRVGVFGPPQGGAGIRAPLCTHSTQASPGLRDEATCLRLAEAS